MNGAAQVIRWLPRLLIAGIVCYLLAFAVRFADERLYADSGYYLFQTMNTGGFHIEHGRWVLAFAEWLPLLGSKLDLSLRSVVLLHSLSNVLFLVLALSYALFVLRDERTLLALCLAQLIGLAHGLFCPVFELYYGVALIILLIGTLTAARLNGWNKLVLASVLFVLALSSHPMAWLLLIGGLALLDPRDRRPFVIPALVLAAGFAVVRWSGMSVYESAQLSFIQRLAFPDLVFGQFTPAVLSARALAMLRHYPDVLALVVVCTALLIRGRRWRAAIIFLSGLLLLYVLIGLYLPDLRHDRYREQVDFGLAAWGIIALFYEAWERTPGRWALILLIAACGIYRGAEAERVAPLYVQRTQWHLDSIAEARAQGLSKAIVDPGNIEFGTKDDRVTLYWSTGVESLLLSAKDGPEKTVSIITNDDALRSGVLAPDQVVLRCGDMLGPGQMNERLFGSSAGSYARLPGVKE